MGDLGMHVLHIPLRAGWFPNNVRALLSNIITERPVRDGTMLPCETWDNAMLACEVKGKGQHFPMLLEIKRIAPGETNTWYLRILGTSFSVEFSTKYPKTLRTMEYAPGGEQAWKSMDIGYETVYPTITGPIFEFGFTDVMLQMWAAFCDQLVNTFRITFEVDELLSALFGVSEHVRDGISIFACETRQLGTSRLNIL